MRTYSESLSEFINNLTYKNIPDSTINKTKFCIIDYLGAIYASYKKEEQVKKYIDFSLDMNNTGDAIILGSKEKTSLPWAIFANGALAHIAEVDDGHRTSIMHPGAVNMPVVFNLAFSMAAKGKNILEAIIAGYEVAIRAGECLGNDHYNIWHTTATAGTFGAAAAAAKMMNLSVQATIYALGHAGSQAAGLWQFLLDGSAEAKPIHTGKAAMNGYLSALLSKRIKGATRIFEGEKGICKASSGNYDLKKLDNKLGKIYKIDEVNFKAYPTCGQTHTAIDAVKKIMLEHSLEISKIKEIKINIYKKAIDIAGIKKPKTIEEAKFSVYFCVAALLVKKEINFNNLSDEDLVDPIICDLMGKIELMFSPELDKKFPVSRPSKVEIILQNDRKFSVENYFRKGDPENPMNQSDIMDKFLQLTAGVLKKEKAKRLFDYIMNIDRINNINEIIYDF